MKTRIAKYGLASVCLLILVGALLVVNSAFSRARAERNAPVLETTSTSGEQLLIPTPVGAQTYSPLPTPQDAIPDASFAATNQDVRIGPVTMITPVPTQVNDPASHFTIREVPGQQPTRPREYVQPQQLFVTDTATGQEVQLGDDRGHASFEVMTDQYLIWRYQWQGISETLTYETGLYAYELGTGKEIVIAQKPDVDPWYPKTDGQWVLYTDGQEARGYYVKMRVHNLTTGEDFGVGNLVPHYLEFVGLPADSYYAIDNGKIVWVEADGGRKLCVYDLATRAERMLDVSVKQPSDLMISKDIVVWWDEGLIGYDLQQDAIFTFTTTPPGWENTRWTYAEPLTLKDEQLYWAIEVNGQAYYFMAPIIRGK